MPGDITREFDLRSNIVVNVEGASLVKELQRSFLDLDKAQKAVANGHRIDKYWNTQLSSLEAVVEQMHKFEDAQGSWREGSIAKDLIKSYNAFIALGGSNEDIVSTMGRNIDDLIERVHQLTPALDSAFSIESLRDAFRAFERAKELGMDVAGVLKSIASGSPDEIKRALEGVTRELVEMRKRAEEAEEKLAAFGDASSVDQLQDKLNTLSTLQRNLTSEFDSFLRRVGLGDMIGSEGLQEYYERIATGWDTPIEAIERFRRQYSYLLEQTGQADAGFTTGEIERFTQVLQSLSDQIIEVRAEIDGLKDSMGSAGHSSDYSAIADGAKIAHGLSEELSHSEALTENQRQVFAGLASSGEALNSVKQVLLELIRTSLEAKTDISEVGNVIVGMIDSLSRLGEVDEGKLSSIAIALHSFTGMKGLSIDAKGLGHLVGVLDELSKLPSITSLQALSTVSFKGFNDLTISKASLSNLATYLPEIGRVNVATIAALAEIRFDNLNNLHVSKASVANIKSLFGIADEITNIRRQMEDAVGAPITTTGTTEEVAEQIQQEVAQVATEVAAAEQAAADAAQATVVAEQAVADIAVETAGAKRDKAAAAQEVSQAEHAEAAAAEQAASAEANAAEAAEVASGAKQAEAQAAKDAATAERDLADAQKQVASQGIGDKEKEESVAMRAAYLKELIDLQKQLEVLQINQPDTYLANQQGFDTLISSLGSAIDEGRADLKGWLNELERTGTVSQETIATVRTLAAEIKKVAAIDAAQQKAQNAIADAELRLQQQHARQAVSSTGGKYYDVEGVQALKDAYTTLADDITKAKAASKSMSDETRNGFISRAEDIVRQSEALREQARSAEEFAQETREYQSTVNSAYRESAEIQREEAEAAKAREAAFQRLEAAARKEAEAEEQAAIREGRAMMKAADDAEAAALKREQSTQVAELKSIQQQAQQALSNAVKNNVDTSAVEYMRNEVNALSADIQKVTADMSAYSEEVRSGFETRLQLIEQSSHAIQVEADAERARAEAAKQQAQIDTTWQKDQAAQAAEAEKTAQAEAKLKNEVTQLLTKYEELRLKHRTTYEQFQEEIDAAIAKMRNEGNITQEEYDKMFSAYLNYDRARRTGAEQQEKDLERETTLRQRAMKLLNQTQHYIDGNSRAYSMFRGQLDGIVQELNKMASGGPGGGGGGPIDPSRLRAIASELDNIKAAANSAGVSGQTFFEKLKAGWQKFAGWSLVTRSFMLVIRGFKSMINSVKELDSAMTELKKVTDLTAAGYQKFFAQAEQSAMKVGATVSDTINATAD